MIQKEKVKDLLYDVYNEFTNELTCDYVSEYKSELTEQDFNIMFEFLERYIKKIELMIEK